jgi:hypothetical protein
LSLDGTAHAALTASNLNRVRAPVERLVPKWALF